MKYTDKQLLDHLQKLNDEAEYTGHCVLRKSVTNRGWRLHETGQKADDFMNGGQTPVSDVRQAIANHIESTS